MAKTESREDKILNTLKYMKNQKAPFMTLYQAASEFVRARRQDFTAELSPGQFLTGDIFDSTATHAAHTAKSAYVGHLWPNAAKSFRIDPPYSLARELSSKEVKDYFNKVTLRMQDYLDNPQARLAVALDEYMLDQVVFGTSGIYVHDTTGDDTYSVPVCFKAVDAKNAYIAEGASGFVDTVYMEKCLTVKQTVQEYGLDAVSSDTREKFENGNFDAKVRILHAIEPRIERSPRNFGNKNMPVGSIHIEIETKKILKESGFNEMPVFMSRFWKDQNEVYGRSPATEGLPEIITLDGYSEILTDAAEKTAGPPLAVWDDCVVGGVVDDSAHAINVVRHDGRLQTNPDIIKPLFTVGELGPIREEKAELKQHIYTMFSVDRLLDLNNETRMTLGEANIRNELRGQSLSNVYLRQITELFDPMVRRAFAVMMAKGLLGVIAGSPEFDKLVAAGYQPDEILIIPDVIAQRIIKGLDVMRVTFVSPAARILKQETMLGIERTLEYAIKVQPVAPEVLDIINIDEVTREIQELTGAPANVLRAQDEVDKIRKDRQAAQQQMMDLEAANAGAQAFKTGSQGLESAQKAASAEQ